MVFNILARNQDDHVKNIAFLMDKSGGWRLAPAFDITWSFNPDGAWTARHQMSTNGKRDGFTLDDLIACGATANIRARKVKSIIDDVRRAVEDWPRFADDAWVEKMWREAIDPTLRVGGQGIVVR